MTLAIFCETARLGWVEPRKMGPHERGIARCTMRSFGGELTRYKKKPYLRAFSMNSMPKYVSANRTATTTSTNTRPKAIMRSLAASLLMSQGMLCNVAEPEAEVVTEEAPWEGVSLGLGVGGIKRKPG